MTTATALYAAPIAAEITGEETLAELVALRNWWEDLAAHRENSLAKRFSLNLLESWEAAQLNAAYVATLIQAYFLGA